jgi:5-methylcytosine-specific restriction endonuclease McrBC GTP-binding regulatory subunit McrB
VSNTLFLSVRPDWRDGTSLLGYYNPLTQTYEWTDFLRFVLNAVDNMNSDKPVAWFVILDEMNLAHVEYYFADLLSVLESGRDSRGFTTEPIRLTYPDIVVNDTPPTDIHLPPNLYIIGTVNMDETTHAFSPKVLDRAFTMELSDVDFLGYQPGNVADRTESSATDKNAMFSAFTVNGWPAIDKTRIGQYVEYHPEIRLSLHDLNTRLARNRFHFGYRVFDEIVQFLANAKVNTMFPSMHDAFDSAVFMKILPKFSGSEGRVGAPLQVLHNWVQEPFGDGSPPLARTLDRVTFMLKRLEEDGFITAF